MGTLHAASACPWEIMASRLSLRNKDIATGATSVLVPCTTFSLQRFWDDELPYKANGRSCQICAFGHLHLFPLGTLGTKKALAHMIRLHVIPIRTGNNLEGKHLSVGKGWGHSYQSEQFRQSTTKELSRHNHRHLWNIRPYKESRRFSSPASARTFTDPKENAPSMNTRPTTVLAVICGNSTRGISRKGTGCVSVSTNLTASLCVARPRSHSALGLP